MKLNIMETNAQVAKSVHDFLSQMKMDNSKRLPEAFARAKENTRKNNQKSTKKIGSVTLSNTDSIGACHRLKNRLNAKLSEIYGSDLDVGLKRSLAQNVVMALANVEQKILEIRRRERAVQEEKTAKKNEKPHEKRRRQRDMEKRTVRIRQDLLYSAKDGGLDPDNLLNIGSAAFSDPAVSVSVEATGFTAEIGDLLAGVADAPEISVDMLT